MTTPSTTDAFDAVFLASQKAKLEEEEKTLDTELARIARKDRRGDDYHAVVEQIGRMPDDNATEEEQYESARSVEQSLELQLREVRAALRKLADGTYGRCSVCGTLIDQPRLVALPSARTCRQHAG